MVIDFSKYNIEEARAIALKYGKQMIERMKLNLHSESLVNRQKLLNSINVTTKVSKGEVEKIQFSYEFYGAIWEHGASNVFGKGVALSKRPWRDSAIELFRTDLEKEFGEMWSKLIMNELEVINVHFLV